MSRRKTALRLVRDGMPFVLVAALAALLAAAMPWRLFVRAPAPERAPAAVCSFVRLTSEQEMAAVRRARAAWQVRGDGVRRLRTNLYALALPEPAFTPAVPISARRRTVRDETVAYAPDLLPATRAVPEPEPLARPAPSEPEPAFSREEMLKMLD